MKISVIDFSHCGLLKQDSELDVTKLKKAGEELYHAFKNEGFAYLSSSGIDRTAVDAVNDTVEEFFALPIEEKKKFCCEKLGTLSYDPLGSMTMNQNRPYDYQEALRIAANDENSDFPNVPNLKQRIRELKEMCRLLLLRVLKALGVGMKLKDPDLFAKSHQFLNKDGNFTILKVIRYPPVLDDTKIQDGQLRIGEHSDFGSVTLLFHDEIGGLQVQTPEGEFIEAPYIPGTILLNIGDMMQFWTGGKLKSTVHRVVFPTDPEKRALPRRSITYFGNVDNEVLLNELEFEDLPTPLKSDKNAITSGEYTRRRFDAAYF